MLRRTTCGILLAALAALTTACSTQLNPTPTTITTTETFTGTLSPANGNVHAFTTLTGGTVVATLTAVGPDATQTIGFDLGTYNATTGVCTVVLDNQAALQGFAFNAQAATIGTYCVRIFDNGNVATLANAGTISAGNPFTYTITVTHP